MSIQLPTILALAGLSLLACGGAGGIDPPPPGTITLTSANPSGDGQSGPPGAPLPAPFRVAITQSGVPVAGRTINWSLVTGSGSLSPSSSTTDASGIAETRLTLGSTVGGRLVQATAAGVEGSPRIFSASAVVAGQFVTVQVVNNLFEPNLVTINRGGTVLFQWLSGSRDHNLIPIAPGTIPNAPVVRDGPSSVEQVFPVAGTYGFFCSVHATATSGSMRGQVIVQ
ncbi:MAG: hypothetical protein AABZ01_12285 [Gemmatimonadota bacterium]